MWYSLLGCARLVILKAHEMNFWLLLWSFWAKAPSLSFILFLVLRLRSLTQ
ncbi:hypothetical protein KFK09_028431 [Dendrobium nobile]|uniref:Uncharacterized protein n=1 Tax=Dendrobium nobile TaxID=94219 RepID=A0A8T3A7H9_DENNO|nr:hypothetical protein KFK09_028431 [Dendrobium nobile]